MTRLSSWKSEDAEKYKRTTEITSQRKNSNWKSRISRETTKITSRSISKTRDNSSSRMPWKNNLSSNLSSLRKSSPNMTMNQFPIIKMNGQSLKIIQKRFQMCCRHHLEYQIITLQGKILKLLLKIYWCRWKLVILSRLQTYPRSHLFPTRKKQWVKKKARISNNPWIIWNHLSKKNKLMNLKILIKRNYQHKSQKQLNNLKGHNYHRTKIN